MKALPFVMLSLLQLYSTEGKLDIACTAQINSCSCDTDQGTIDLSPLKGANGQPKFPDVVNNVGGDAFSYNPCEDFTEGTCAGVAACQVQGTGSGVPLYYSLGSQSSAAFVYDQDRGLELRYDSDATGTDSRKSYIQLHCNENEGSLRVDGEDPQNPGNYYMTLTSKHACPGGVAPVTDGPPSPATSITLSPGGILLIIFFVLLAVYFIAGILVQKLIRRASGREVIPNVEFWASLPTLIKEGCMFIARGGKRLNYESK